MNYDICLAAEQAVADCLKALNLEWCQGRIYQGIENTETQENEGQESSMRQLPCIMVKSERAQAHSTLMGNWAPHVDVWVISNRNETTYAQHRQRAQQVFAAMCYNSIEANLNGANFFCARVQPTETGHTAEGSAWVSFMEFDLQGATATDLREA